MKKKVFIAINSIINQGGVSTSIQNLLNEIHQLHDITLCAINDYISPSIDLPKDINIIPGSRLIGDAITNRNFLRYGLFNKLKMLATRLLRRIKGFDYIIEKGIKQINVPFVEYDVAIAFSGNQFDSKGNLYVGGDYELVRNRINAKWKVAWMHNDIRMQGYTRDIALREFSDFDSIVAVSDENKKKIADLVGEYKNKVHVVYNMYNIDKIKTLANNSNPYPDNGNIHFVTVARLDLRQKRQDRIIKACSQLKSEGFRGFDWYLVGGGDYNTLEKMSQEMRVKDIVHLVGLQKNPYPYMLYADAFVLSSLYEGYGMTIKEAQILGCPTLVTNFGPAHEAVDDYHQGFICDNSTEGVYKMIKYILRHPEKLQQYRKYLKEHTVTNEKALNQFLSACNIVGL